MNAADLLRACLMLLHGLAGAAWFGSIFYSIFVLYPRLGRHFADIAERERFLLALSHGARWHMIAAMSIVALSGIGLLVRREAMSETWWTLMAAKTILLIACAVFFWRISWHWWPARLFALNEELPAIHARFRIAAACMLVMVGLNVALGLLGRVASG